MTSSSISSMLRVSGISSGLDTDSIIKNLMGIEKLKVDRVTRQKITLEWKLDAHKTLNDKISAFRSATMSVLSADNLYSTSAFNTFKVNQDTASNSVSLAATSDATVGSSTINSITRIASAAQTSSFATLSTGNGLTRTDTLADLDLATPLVFGGAGSDEISFAINSKTFTFKKTDTLKTMVNTINSSDAGVLVNYSELSDKLSITSKTTGAASAINITNTTGNAFGPASAFGIVTLDAQNGADALLSINGYSVTRSDNNFNIDGISYTLKAASATPINFSVERNTDSTFDKIKNFVTKYNELVSSLQTSLDEEPDSDYTPLIDTEKEAMSESEITSWETKAKAGLLHNDRNIANLLTAMRRMIYDTVEGTGSSLSSIGLTTGAYADGGKITLDETKLRSALASNPDQVMNIFTRTSDTKTYEQMGFLPRLAASLTSYTGTFSKSTALQEISKITTKIGELEEKMAVKEEILYKKYSAMETAMAKFNSQSSWIAQQASSK